MKFWDTSAIVPTLVEEPSSDQLRAVIADDPNLTTWWATIVECGSAVARRERSGSLPTDAAAEALATLDMVAGSWTEVPPTDQLRERARRAVRVHELRAADALQLAAALIAADSDAGTLPFVTLDERLALAARREGFPVLPGVLRKTGIR